MKEKRNNYNYHQKKEFLNQERKKIELAKNTSRTNLNAKKKEKIIAVMLDVQGTIEGIDDNLTKRFMKMLHKLRIKFNASKVYLNLTFSESNPRRLDEYLKIIDRNLIPNIILDEVTFKDGTYDYYQKRIEREDAGYNQDKFYTFREKYYFYDVCLYAIIDDEITPDYINDKKDITPLVICRPSQREISDLRNDNLMCYSTMIKSFEGVCACLDKYWQAIANLSKEKILENQQKMLVSLSSADYALLCIYKKYDLLDLYLNSGLLKDIDYMQIKKALEINLELGKSGEEREKIEKMLNNISLKSYRKILKK